MVEICRDLNELHPKVKQLAQALLDKCQQQGLNIKISETYRSMERQEYLYEQGRTRPGSIVTNARGSSMSSYHQWRLAFDVYQNIKGAEYDKRILAKVGTIGEALGLDWGGSWSSFSDTPHFQYTFGLSIKDLNSGKRPPNETPSKDVAKDSVVKDGVDKEYETAVDILVKRGIINSKADWIPKLNVNYTTAIIQKLVNEIIKNSYDDQLKILVDKKIITELTKWKDKDIGENDLKWLIKKSAIFFNQ
ncbi:M15 family metallopeptidase [Niameybacter sp.]|uniref:M15 family metallopeptidase n=1 Tax=Niameybacter sp. TaxID=2033640 RepID=UPI002FC5B999